MGAIPRPRRNDASIECATQILRHRLQRRIARRRLLAQRARDDRIEVGDQRGRCLRQNGALPPPRVQSHGLDVQHAPDPQGDRHPLQIDRRLATGELVKQRRAANKPALLLVDISGITGHDADVRDIAQLLNMGLVPTEKLLRDLDA